MSKPFEAIVDQTIFADVKQRLSEIMSLGKVIVITWDSSIDTNLAYSPDGAVICTGDIGSVLLLAQRQHYDLILYTWPDQFLAVKDPRLGSLS